MLAFSREVKISRFPVVEIQKVASLRLNEKDFLPIRYHVAAKLNSAAIERNKFQGFNEDIERL
mgnify:FL=1